MPSSRAPVQGNRFEVGPWEKRGPGTVSWEEHEVAWEAYAKQCGRRQTAERIAERGGFGYNELCKLLGHEPTTWEPVRSASGARKTKGEGAL